MKIPLSLLFLILPAACASAAGPVLPDYLPAQTKVILGINVRSLADSPVVKTVLAQSHAMPAGTADWLKLASAMGFDPLRDIDELLIASGADRKDAPVLIAVRGRFRPDRLGAAARMYHDVPILSGGKDGKGIVAILDASNAIMGDADQVRAAIDRRGHGGLAPELAAAAEAMRSRYDLWGLGADPKGFVAPAETPEGLQSVDRFQFGLRASRGLELSAEVHTPLPKDADQMLKSMGMLEAMMKAWQTPESEAHFAAQAENGTLSLHIDVPETEVQRALTSQAGAPRPVAGAAVEANPGAQPADAAPTAVLNPEGGTGAVTLPGAP